MRVRDSGRRPDLHRKKLWEKPRLWLEGYLVDWHADGVDEAQLHAGKLVFLVAIEHIDGLDIQYRLLKVTLLEELACKQVRHLEDKPQNIAAGTLILVSVGLLCVCVCVRACVRVCACVCVSMSICGGVNLYVCQHNII